MTKILMAALAVVTFVAFTSQADARHRYKHHKKPTLITDRLPVIADANGNQAIKYSITFSGKRHYRRHARGGCDGFHRCRCGVTAARLHGLPLNYNGLNLKMARSYYAFPRTTCHAGAIGIPHAHHVYTVQQCNGDGTALVSDDAGTYTRRVAGNTFVDVGTVTASASRHHRRYASHRHYRHQYATYYGAPYQYAVNY